MVKRAQLRNVSGNDLNNTPQVLDLTRNIMLSSAENKNSLSTNTRPADCNTPQVVKRKTLRVLNKNKDYPLFPISNFPPVQEYDGGMPDDPTVVEIFALRRELAALRRDMAAARKKITRSIEALHATRRFLRVGLFEHQWETHDELRRRLANIEGVLALLDDPVWGIDEKIEIPERWKNQDR